MKQSYRQFINKEGSASLILDLSCLVNQYQSLTQALPRVDFFYAVKALSHPEVLATLQKLGCGFDVASRGEIDLLRRTWVSAKRMIHTHPIKSDYEIREALRYGCTTFVVDNLAELEKFVPYRHRVRLLLRLSFCNKDAVVDLSRKFGCEPQQAHWLLQKAKQLNIHVKGLSFHVGSQSLNAKRHVEAIQTCQQLMAEAYRQGITLSVLDIGGGFPVAYDQSVPDIHSFCQPIRQALSALPKHIQVIAEPGRYLVAPVMTAVCQVVGKAYRNGKHWYYLNDGVYGAFSGQIYDHACYPISVPERDGRRHPSVLAGPTCDCVDIIRESIDLPLLAVGDIVVARMMGAYTLASASRFNGLPLPEVTVVNRPGFSLPAQDKLASINY